MSHVLNAPAPTVHWPNRQILGRPPLRTLLGSEEWRFSILCMCSRHGDRHPQPQPDMLHAGSPDTSSTNWPHSTGTGVLCQGSMLYYWSDLTTLWRSIIIVLLPLLILLPPPPFHFLFLKQVFLLSALFLICDHIIVWLPNCICTYMHGCKCWLLTDEGSHSIPTLVPPSIKSSCYMSEFHVRLGTVSFMLS